MSDLIEQCRQEWKRLGVSDELAGEMAGDLSADLAEAEADGVSAEALLGAGAADPRSFAAAWAAERGIVPPPSHRPDARRGRRVLIAFTALAATALIVSALLLATGEPKVALVTSGPAHAVPPSSTLTVPPGRVTASAATPIEWILLCLAIVALAFAAWLWTGWGRTRAAAPSSTPEL